MSPQVPALNRGIWRALEEKIRQWVLKEKELYVITGPIIRPGYTTIGPNKVAVPQWYYKIIIDYYQPETKAIAFMIPNRKPQKSLQDFVVNIDKLEEVTQLDFLNFLPDKVQKQLESKMDLSLWGLTTKKPDISKLSKNRNTEVRKYWITSTNKRHNSSCRFYKNSKGKLGGERDGIACKLCGG